MSQALGAEKGERVEGRLGYRSGYYVRSLITRVGKLELRVPQDRQGRFSSALFERYQRSEKALVGALAEMYVQGVSTRKVKAITEELCGHEFSASAISAINKRLDEELHSFMDRSLEEEFAYLILDARYEKVREAGVIRSRAVLVALGVDWEGRRQVLAVELANRESATSWKEFLLKLKSRGLRGVVLAVSDDHAGLKRSLAEVLPQAYWQRWPDVQLIARAHFHGMRNIGATLTSFEDTFKGTPLEGYYNTDKEQKRQAVNQWIRSSNNSQSHSVGLYVIRRLSLQW